MERSRFTVLVVVIAVVAGVTIGLSPFASRGEQDLGERVRADRSEDHSPGGDAEGEPWRPPSTPSTSATPGPEGDAAPPAPLTQVLGVRALRTPLDLLRRRPPVPRPRDEAPVEEGWRWFLGDDAPLVVAAAEPTTSGVAPAAPPWFAPPTTSPGTTTTRPTTPPTAPPTTAAPPTTTEPPVTTTEPEVTTTLPEVTTTLPEPTTTLPEVTTTLPEPPPDPVVELPLPFGLGVELRLDLP